MSPQEHDVVNNEKLATWNRIFRPYVSFQRHYGHSCNKLFLLNGRVLLVSEEIISSSLSFRSFLLMLVLEVSKRDSL